VTTRPFSYRLAVLPRSWRVCGTMLDIRDGGRFTTPEAVAPQCTQLRRSGPDLMLGPRLVHDEKPSGCKTWARPRIVAACPGCFACPRSHRAGVVRPGCCTSLLYSDAIHKLGMADDGPGMLVTCNRLEEGVAATSTDCA